MEIKKPQFKELHTELVIYLPPKNHLMVNGYANSWIIDPNEVCNNSGIAASFTTPRNDKAVCIKNPDGSYDIELVRQLADEVLAATAFPY